MPFTPNKISERAEIIPEGERFIDHLLSILIEKKGSDLHIVGDKIPVIRVDGDIIRISGRPGTDEPVAIPNKIVRGLLRQLLDPQGNLNEEESSKQIGAILARREFDFAYEMPNTRRRFRVNVGVSLSKISIVARSMPDHIMTMNELGLPNQFSEILSERSGLVLVTGPTGSGKTTTINAIINEINETQSKVIVTIEDPCEVVHDDKKSHVMHREVGRDTASFNLAFESALRQDPDVIFIGELRTVETVETALKAAETGHLVLATLHTQSAVSTLYRIAQMFPPEKTSEIFASLRASLRCVVSQVLVRRNGGGRRAAHEIMIVTETIRNNIGDGFDGIRTIYQNFLGTTNIRLDDELIRLASTHEISADEAISSANDTKYVREHLERKQVR